MLNNKSNAQISKTSRQLNPIQLKKTLRPPSQRTTINCDTSSVTSNTLTNNLQFQYKNVYDFLKDLNMENYLEQFIKNGITNEEKILYLNNDNLKLINIPYAHRARFLKKLKEIEKMKLMKKTFTESGGLSKVKVKRFEKNAKYEEIFIPKEEDDIDIGEEEQRDTFAQAIVEYQKSHNKFENQDNNEFFSTGISNMRKIEKKKSSNKLSNRYSEINEDKNNGKDVKQNEKENKNENKNKNELDEDNKSRKSAGVGDNIEPAEIGDYIENKDTKIIDYNNPTESIPGIPRAFFPLNKSKTLCYNCLHMILEEHCIQKFKKPFCSLHCLEIFEKKNVTSCDNCEKKIEIINSIPSNSKEKIYYCSLECLKKKEPNENSFINKSQVIHPNNISENSSEESGNNIDILDF